ncbi:YitT family protein [Kaistia dalseonensis]|uniref:Uncharacterized membrane-anchored protein YitT (DUF2179 family) n=1 Tax=Kaistia dalseonensis TaxID=410840 RepID=A0ABU0H372_9HYPH|nr:YitT family protein [Kaistia dalseonensis]MCX5494168.1 YitT family protein [Kaistia dalseonensis]MDQ0436747.1 uncharacterized membrane-anchored protein YitT (DUF2179 family) [Kaistia dalseonensis]
MDEERSLAHSLSDDALAFLIGTLFIALGLAVLKAAGLGIGGTAGIAFLTNVATGLDFGTVFFLINVPFFIFAYLAFGPVYLLRSVIATAMLSAESSLLPSLISFGHVAPIFAAIMGGLLCGMGMLSLIRHQAGVGGFATAAVYLQDRLGWRAGKLLMIADLCVLAAAFLLIDPHQVVLSILAVVCLNIVLALYHKPGRYAGFARFARARAAAAASRTSRMGIPQKP